MPNDKQNIDKPILKRCRCPECFKKEIDLWLKYDKEDREYYCVKCCYTEKDVNKIMKNFDGIRRDKFKLN